MAASLLHRVPWEELPHQIVRRDLDHRPLPVPRDVEIALDVAPHSIEAKVGKLNQKPLVGKRVLGGDRKRPDLAMDRFTDVQCLAVRSPQG